MIRKKILAALILSGVMILQSPVAAMADVYSGAEEAESGETGTEESESEKTGTVESESGETGTEESGSEETGEEETGSGETGAADETAEILLSGAEADISFDPDGYYHLECMADRNYTLRVADGSLSDSGNVNIGKKTLSADSWFRIVNNADGTFTFRSARSGKVLDVKAGSKDNFANVQQYSANGTAAQKWTVVPNEDGSCEIINAGSGKALDIMSGIIKNGQNVSQYTRNGTAAQKWCITQVGTDPKPEEGILCTALGSSERALTVNGSINGNGVNVCIKRNTESDTQRWSFKRQADGTYFILNGVTGKALDVYAGGCSNRDNIWCYAENGSNAQRWIIIQDPDGTVTLINKGSGFAADVEAAADKDLANVWQYQPNGTWAQKWYITQAHSPEPDPEPGEDTEDPIFDLPEPTDRQSSQVGANVTDYCLPAGFSKEEGEIYRVPGGSIAIRLRNEGASITMEEDDFRLFRASTDRSYMELNRIRLQSAMDRVSAAGGGTILISEGVYYIERQPEPYEYWGSIQPRYGCLEARDNVTIAGTSKDGTVMTWINPCGTYDAPVNVFYCPFTAEREASVENADFRDLGIDGYNCTHTGIYEANGKGYMLYQPKDCDWYNCIVKNTDGTGFGIDEILNCTITNCTAVACGKRGTSGGVGASGFGIGYGRSKNESIIVRNCLSLNNRRFGFFFESQSRFAPQFPYDTVDGPLLAENCISGGNYYNYGGEFCNGAQYVGCISKKLGSGYGYSNPLGVKNAQHYHFGDNCTENFINGSAVGQDEYFYASKTDEGFFVKAKSSLIEGTVHAAAWSDTGGQDDLKWYPLSKNADGSFSTTVSFANLKHDGKVHFHFYTVNSKKLKVLTLG